MIEKKFIKENLRLLQVDEFLSKEFARAGYSHSDIQRTPLSMRITVFAQKPGMVIGRGGKTIEAMTQALKEKFGIENPQLDVQEVENPDLDASIISKQIAAAIERGLNYKRVVNLALTRIMQAGALGVAIRISGKLGGEIGRTEKFSAGYLKFTGEPAEKMRKAYATAQVKLGHIGIQVRILSEIPKDIEAMRKVEKELAAAPEVMKTVKVRRDMAADTAKETEPGKDGKPEGSVEGADNADGAKEEDYVEIEEAEESGDNKE
ncbi:MAG: 30S ribosomal protein S3 [Candidatus Aenigmatarchaeota archaeon]